MRRPLFAHLLGTAHRGPLLRASTPPAEEGAPSADTSGVNDTGRGLSYTPPAPDPNAPPAQPEQTEERPKEWPEGVDSWEAFGKLSPEDRAKALQASNEAPAPTEAKEGLDLLVEEQTAGMDPERKAIADPFIRSFAEKGDLTAEEVKDAASKLGLSEVIVQQYVDNAKEVQAKQAEAEAGAFTALTGGAEQWAKFNEWATTALGPEDHAKINGALDANKPADVQYAVDLWKAAGNGPAPRDLTTQARTEQPGSSAQGNGGFASAGEMMAAMNDPRYNRDEAYTKEVERRTGLM